MGVRHAVDPFDDSNRCLRKLDLCLNGQNAMNILRGLDNLKSPGHGCAVTIGNFDGVHQGHRFVIETLVQYAKQRGLPVAIVLFEPQPLEYFLKDQAPARLTRLKEKLIHLAVFPVDLVVLLRFDKKLAELEPETFIRRLLIDGLNTQYLAVGDDFRFGKNRKGDISLLKEVGRKQGFAVENLPSFRFDNDRVSSTSIRHALEAGRLDRARDFLGRRYSVWGRVIEGAKRGRLIGFPTANIRMYRENTPVKGVFAVTMTGIDNREISGVANVGTRPTVDGSQLLLEVHLFDFQADIYGRFVEIHFWQKIRDEKRFDSFEELKKQIENDALIARKLFQKLD